MSASPRSISSTGRMDVTGRKATCSRLPGADAAVAEAAEVVAGAAAGAVAAEGAAHAGDGAAGAELNGLTRGRPGGSVARMSVAISGTTFDGASRISLPPSLLELRRTCRSCELQTGVVNIGMALVKLLKY